ncbi:hypothetical protein DIPPA_02431 [Diplonema papillatum]|nr:hypothetical protein DIPPA_02431 [Diplonema papillatum]
MNPLPSPYVDSILTSSAATGAASPSDHLSGASFPSSASSSKDSVSAGGEVGSTP